MFQKHDDEARIGEQAVQLPRAPLFAQEHPGGPLIAVTGAEERRCGVSRPQQSNILFIVAFIVKSTFNVKLSVSSDYCKFVKKTNKQ